MNTSELDSLEHGQHLNTQGMQSWNCEQLISHVFDELLQPSAAIETNISGLVQGFLDKKTYPFASEKQRDVFLRLHAEEKSIPFLTRTILFWLVSKKVIKNAQLKRDIRADEQFMAHVIEKNIVLQDILLWSDEQFIRYISDELRQKSAVIGSLVDILLNDSTCTVPYDWQKKILMWIQADIQKFQVMAANLNTWLVTREKT